MWNLSDNFVFKESINARIESKMDILENPLVSHFDPETGRMEPYDHYRQIRLSDMRGYYLADREAPDAPLEDDPVLYEVYERIVPEKGGEMVPCSTIIHPGGVGDEFYMTKGHYHSSADAAEIYYCLRGDGLLMMLKDDECVMESMRQGALIYVPAGWAHRSVNVGKEDLIIFAIYPADAGHDYGSIKEEGFGKRVLRGKDGGYEIREESGQ